MHIYFFNRLIDLTVLGGVNEYRDRIGMIKPYRQSSQILWVSYFWLLTLKSGIENRTALLSFYSPVCLGCWVSDQSVPESVTSMWFSDTYLVTCRFYLLLPTDQPSSFFPRTATSWVKDMARPGCCSVKNDLLVRLKKQLRQKVW